MPSTEKKKAHDRARMQRKRAAQAEAILIRDDLIFDLCEALKPFAKSADWPLFNIEEDRPVNCRVCPKVRTEGDNFVAGFGFSVGEFYAAKAALAKAQRLTVPKLSGA